MTPVTLSQYTNPPTATQVIQRKRKSSIIMPNGRNYIVGKFTCTHTSRGLLGQHMNPTTATQDTSRCVGVKVGQVTKCLPGRQKLECFCSCVKGLDWAGRHVVAAVVAMLHGKHDGFGGCEMFDGDVAVSGCHHRIATKGRAFAACNSNTQPSTQTVRAGGSTHHQHTQ